MLLYWLVSAALLSLARNLRYCNTTKEGDANAKPKKHRQIREGKGNPHNFGNYSKKNLKAAINNFRQVKPAAAMPLPLTNKL